MGNPGTPPWPTADGKGDWLSDEGDPQAAATDGKWVFLAAPGSEKGWSVIAVDENGQRQWGLNLELYPRSTSLAVHGDCLYLLFCGPEFTKPAGRFDGTNAEGRAILICMDKKTGALMRFSRKNPRHRVATYPYTSRMAGMWDLFNEKRLSPETYGGKPRYADIDFGEPANAIGLAVTSKTVYCSMLFEDRLMAVNAETGAPEPDKDIPLKKPAGLHALDDNTLLAVSDGHLVKVDLKTKKAQVVVREGLSSPHTPTTDRNGNIYVSDWGKSFQAKVFSPTGRFLRAIGKEGGRALLGKWGKHGMLVPRGIAVTDDGKLWVAEDDGLPRRVSVWDARSGTLLREYIGPTPYGGGSTFWGDKKDMSIVHTMGRRFKVDWKKKTYEVEAVELRRTSMFQPFVPDGSSSGGGIRQFIRDGREYVAVSPGNKSALAILMRKGDTWVPVAAMGGLHRWSTTDGTDEDQWDSDIGRHRMKNYRPAFFAGHQGDNYAWTDLNGNGLVEANEMTWMKSIFRGDKYEKNRQPEFQTNWGQGIGPDWSIYMVGFCADCHIIDRFDVLGWTKDGAPIYDIGKFTEIANPKLPIGNIYVNDNNQVFAVGGLSGQLGRKPIEPGSTTMLCLDRDGKELWRIAAEPQQRAKSLFASGIQGEFKLPSIGNVLATWHWWGNWRPYFFTQDGLYVGTALTEGKFGPSGLWDESLNYFYQSANGTPHIVNGGNNAHHFLELKGLENGGRFEKDFTITPEQAKLAAASIPDSDAAPEEKIVVGMTWLDRAPVIDGQLDDWQMGTGVDLDDGAGHAATIALARDENMLYLAAYVADDSPLLNKGANWQTLFISGDCVDLHLGTNPQASASRRGAEAGDVRLLLTVHEEKPVAVLYRPVVPGHKDKAIQLMAAHIDRIDMLKEAQVAFTRGDSFYELEAAVPIKSLGLDPTTTAPLRGDVGVIFSDATGRDRVKRLYHYNQKTTMTADLTTEATLQPAEWGTILLPLGRNLLRNGGFEGAFSNSREDGWKVVSTHSGMEVSMSPELPYSGHRSLLFRQTQPVHYSKESFQLQDYGAFIRSANDGKGGGQATVQQRFPVKAGHKYQMRVHYRTYDLKSEEKGVGPNRGYSMFSVWIYWEGGEGGHVWLADVKQATEAWAHVYGRGGGAHGTPMPYTVPNGVTHAVVSLSAVVNAPHNFPTVFVDQVEFVEVEK